MTSFAFILGCVPLWIATGSGAAGRRILGTVVVSGMLADTIIASFLIPVAFYVVGKMTGGRREIAPESELETSPPPVGKWNEEDEKVKEDSSHV